MEGWKSGAGVCPKSEGGEPMSYDQADKEAEEILPCKENCNPFTARLELRHAESCPYRHRRAIAAKLRESYIAGLEAAREALDKEPSSYAGFKRIVYYTELANAIQALIDTKTRGGE